MNKKTLRLKLKASVLAVALTALPLTADAAGLGKITVLSALGQPLRAEIDLSANGEELATLSAHIASADAFKQAGVEFTNVLTNIRFVVDKRPDGQPILRMRSDQPLGEPFLDLLVELNWASGRMVREYTFLLDPPESMQKPVFQAAPVTPPLIAAPDAKREAPGIQPREIRSPAPSSATPEPQKKPGDDMKVVRGADGIQRIVKAEAAAEKPPQGQHTVKRGETLNRIATQAKPDGVSLDQMLIALFRNNKEAFDGSNINRLKTGKILAIPDRDTVAAIDEAEAKKFILAQSADFNAYRKHLADATAGAAEQKEQAPKQAASGKITPLVKDQAPPAATGKDKLEISKSAATKGAGAAEEALLSQDKALKEANARIAELDKNINDLKKLVELKNQSMADLQKQAATPAASPTAPPPPAAETKPAAAQPPEKPAETPAAKPVEPPAAEKPTPPAEKIPVAPKPVAKKPAPPPPVEEPGFIEDNLELILAGGGVLALLLGYLGFSTWRKKRQEEADLGPDSTSPSTQNEPSINSVFGSTGGQIVDTGSSANSLQTDFSVAGAGGADASKGVDPIAEADVYMAYGRNAQAEEILLDALKTDPTRQAIHLKLLEIYAERKSIKQFETIAIDLQTLTSASGPSWEKAVQLGQQIDPQNELYRGKPAPEAGFDPAATMVLSSQDLEELEPATASEPMQETIIEPAAKLTPEAPQEKPEIQPESLDFDLDLGGDSSLATAETTAESLIDQPKTAAAAAGDIDFDFDLGEPAASTPAASAAPDNVDFDFDLGSGESSAAPEAGATPAATPAEDVPDFDLDLSAPAPALAEEAATIQIEPESSAKNEDAPLDFDFDLDMDTKSEAPPLPLPKVDLSSISLDLDDGADKTPAPSIPAAAPVIDEAASQEVATKLELAQAYEEMGDKDGARELLQEVLNEGNETQQTTARSKLALLG